MVNRKGFTLIELLIVVVILGVLLGIALTRYNDILRKANEGATRGNLGTVRSALRVYYADMEGIYPENLAVLAENSRLLPRIPLIEVPFFHPDSAETRLAAGAPNDAGGWHYNNVSTDVDFGTLWVNCSHTDTLSSVWTSY